MGCKKLSDEEEKRLVELYKSGVSVKQLMLQFDFKTKKIYYR